MLLSKKFQMKKVNLHSSVPVLDKLLEKITNSEYTTVGLTGNNHSRLHSVTEKTRSELKNNSS